MAINSTRVSATSVTLGGSRSSQRHQRGSPAALLLMGMWLVLPATLAAQTADAGGDQRITAVASIGNDTLSRNGNFVTVETAFNLQISFEHTLTPGTTVRATASARAVYGCIDDNGAVFQTLTVDEEVRAARRVRPVDNSLAGALLLRPPGATGFSCPADALALLSVEFSHVILQSSAGALTELGGTFSNVAGSCVCVPGNCCCGKIGKPCTWCHSSKPCAFNVAGPAAEAKPDLVPESPSSSPHFCRAVGGRLSAVIGVKNKGSVFAPASITRVDFSPFGSVDLPTAGIAPGGFLELGPVSLPAGCFNPDCDFRITVDVFGGLDEGAAGKLNNIAVGICIG